MKTPKIRILVADDHPYVRDGIVSLLAMERDMQVVAQAGDGTEALTLAKKLQPDIVLIDLRMPQMDGLQAIAHIKALGLRCSVIVLTTYESEHDIHHALKAGARGYLLKNTPRAVLMDAIRRVQRGETSIPQCISQKLAGKMNRPELTEREFEVLKLIAEGGTNKDIGERLGISEGTVKMHVKGLLTKMNAPGRTAAVAEAVHRGLVHLA